MVKSSLSTRSHRVGDLFPDETACVWVKADNEASIELTFMAPDGASKVIPLHGYFEPGESGWISAEVTVEGSRTIDSNIDPF
jgi:hypothetical protein